MKDEKHALARSGVYPFSRGMERGKRDLSSTRAQSDISTCARREGDVGRRTYEASWNDSGASLGFSSSSASVIPSMRSRNASFASSRV